MGDRPLNRPWRLITTEPAAGDWNMALDEALSETVRAGGLPFLRFYSWNPGTLSLGRFQNPTDGLSETAQAVPRVRRPTGGGGIWHEDELTYSLACLQTDLNVKGVKASFEKLCGFLLDAWQELGWNAHFAKDAGEHPALGGYTPACFAGHEEYDVLVDGKKLGGNAQRRDRESLFQHGSLPMNLDWERLDALFLPGFRPERTLTTDLRSSGWLGSALDLIPLLSEAFRRRLGVEWKPISATGQELARANELIRERFGNSSWTESGGGSLRLKTP